MSVKNRLAYILGAIVARRFSILAFLVPLFVYCLTLNGIWSTDYPSSIMGLQWSLWVHHSFSLGPQGHSVVSSVDIGTFKGNSYSEISPGYAIISLPFAIVGILRDGGALNVFGHLLLADELFLALASSLSSFFVFKMCRLYAQEYASLAVSLTFALATPLWPDSTVVFIEGASVMFSTASIYFVLRNVKFSGTSISPLIASGLLLAGAAFVEYMAALFVFPLVAYLLLSGRGVKRSLVFTLSFIAGPLLWLFTNYLTFSNPFVFPEQLKAGSILAQFNFGLLFYHAAAYIISPYRGILVFSPVLILGFISIYQMIRKKRELLRLDGILFLVLFLLILFGYSGWRDWAGGLAYGPRFMLLGLAYLTIPISILISKYSGAKKAKIILISLFIISLVVEGIGTFTTAFSSAGDVPDYQLYQLNFPWFVQGKFDTWWLGKSGLQGPLEYQLVALCFFVLISMYFCFLVSRIHSVQKEDQDQKDHKKEEDAPALLGRRSPDNSLGGSRLSHKRSEEYGEQPD